MRSQFVFIFIIISCLFTIRSYATVEIGFKCSTRGQNLYLPNRTDSNYNKDRKLIFCYKGQDPKDINSRTLYLILDGKNNIIEKGEYKNGIQVYKLRFKFDNKSNAIESRSSTGQTDYLQYPSKIVQCLRLESNRVICEDGIYEKKTGISKLGQNPDAVSRLESNKLIEVYSGSL